MQNRRAVVTTFGLPNVIQIICEPHLPIPGPSEVRVRVEASSMVFTDTLIRRGIYPYLQVEPPFTLGYDFIGVVDAVGTEVTEFSEGDRVADITQIGSNADYVIRPAAQLIPVPQGINAAQAETFLLSGMTAFQMLHRIAQVQPGERILVHGGAGAVGSALVHLGLLHRLHVVTTAASDNLALLRSMGAEAVDYRSPDLYRQLKQLSGDGFHAAFDGVGMSSFRRSFSLLAPNGILIPYGFVAAARMVSKKTAVGSLIGGLMFASSNVQFKLWNVLPNKRQVRDYDLASYRREHPLAYRQDIQRLFQLLEAGEIQPLIHRTYSLDDLQSAHEALALGGIRGRLVITHSS